MSNNELDSHADTCCFGSDAPVLSFELSQIVDVSGFLPTMGNVETPIANVAMAQNDETTNVAYILFFHQVQHIKDMTHTHISPF
jgi:hypothetical protein